MIQEATLKLGPFEIPVELDIEIPEYPSNGEPQVVTLFEDGDIDVYSGGININDRFEDLGGYVYGNTLTVWGSQSGPDLDSTVERLEVVPRGLPPASFGGVGSRVRGSVEVWDENDESVSGVCFWIGGRLAVVMKVPMQKTTGKLEFLRNGHPHDFNYGLYFCFSIPLV